ncbi:MAG TPA: hypothetical protein VFU59_06050 [Candidatus Eisenbacteria bacterium]|nr:hypothetical protein [Candidatus Eisenbacteria bacterium]
MEIRLTLAADDVIGEVLGTLRERGIAVVNLTKQEPSLESVFVHLVGRGLEEADAPDSGEAS